MAFLIFSCGKDDDTSGTQNDPIPSFQITFYAVDSLGSLVFPVDGEYLSVHSPEDFYASNEFTEDIGHYNSNSTYGHVFRIVESLNVIWDNEPVWQTDSIIEFYSCFASECDTLVVFNPLNSCIGPCAEWIYWNGDTIFNYQNGLIPYVLNQ
jgi:hypothetical protein